MIDNFMNDNSSNKKQLKSILFDLMVVIFITIMTVVYANKVLSNKVNAYIEESKTELIEQRKEEHKAIEFKTENSEENSEQSDNVGRNTYEKKRNRNKRA